MVDPIDHSYLEKTHMGRNRSWFTRSQLSRAVTIAAAAAWPVFIVAVAVFGGGR